MAHEVSDLNFVSFQAILTPLLSPALQDSLQTPEQVAQAPTPLPLPMRLPVSFLPPTLSTSHLVHPMHPSRVKLR